MFTQIPVLRLTVMMALVMAATAISALGQTSGFTYQGRLTDGGTAATGIYDLQFALFDGASAGTQVGATQTAASVSVSAGQFSVLLDFGVAAFPGANRFLEIGVRLAGGGAFTTLSTRQQITSTPYAVRSGYANATDVATNALQLGGVAAAQYTQTNDARLSDPRAPNPGSANYVQNTTGQQASTNFNVSGNGTAGGTLKGDVVNAVTQYNLGGSRVLSVAGTNNTFAGLNAGLSNTGSENAFFGRGAGFSNAAGTDNAFFGYQAGQANTTGGESSFFGSGAGQDSTAGQNSFFGYQAGKQNVDGSGNAFFGDSAGKSVGATTFSNSFFGTWAGKNDTGSFNSFFGAGAGAINAGSFNVFFGGGSGANNTTGSYNAFFGDAAGYTNTTGNGNTFVGEHFGPLAGNTTGDYNTTLGADADVGSSNLSFATAIGAWTVVSSSNTVQLGRADGSDYVLIPGLLTIPNLAVAGSTQLCRNSFNRVGTCSSSLRYKTNLAPYRSGLSVVNRLRPISFTWKEGGMRDLGFGAEDVEKIDPLLVTYNKQGQVEGVKYDRINVVLVNALKEQQQQIAWQQSQLEKQQRQNEGQQRQIESLKRLVCLSHSKATICK